jgi:hypothetical protein
MSKMALHGISKISGLLHPARCLLESMLNALLLQYVPHNVPVVDNITVVCATKCTTLPGKPCGLPSFISTKRLDVYQLILSSNLFHPTLMK